MSPDLLDSAAASILDLALRSSLILALVLVAFGVLSRRSAALRHFVGLVGVAALLSLPFAMSGLPARLAALPSARALVPQPVIAEAPAGESLWPEESGHDGGAAPVTANASAGLGLPALLAGLWLLGTAVVAVRVVASSLALRGFFARGDASPAFASAVERLAETHGLPARTAVRSSREVDVAVTFGSLEAKILLPEDVHGWSRERLDMVLTHELAHVARLDRLAQLFALAACALYWWHPLAWMVSRRLDLERERACDDRVVGARGDARSYARQLVDIAEGLAGRKLPTFGVSMARPSHLRRRMQAVLDAAVDRRRTRLAEVATILPLAAVLLLPVSEFSGRESGPRRAG